MLKEKAIERRDVEKLALKHAIINAFQHNGKADVKVVLGKVIGEQPNLKSDVKNVIEIIESYVNEINNWPTTKLKKGFESLKIKPKKKKREGILPPLPKAKNGKVVMRLAPYPSGPLHIGNARMVVLNDEYAKRYKGRLLLVYDDTIGTEEKKLIPDGYRLIREGLDWLGVKIHKEIFKSDRLPVFYKYAELMLKKDFVYVCLCSPEELRSFRKKQIACSHRNQGPEENLNLWKGMLEGRYNEHEATVRLKTDMAHPNPAFRDRVLLRISNRMHPRVGNNYRVWPMLEFSWAIDDHEFGITHVLRGKELMIEDLMEDFIFEKMGWEKLEFLHYGMLRLEGTKLSKSKSRAAIESGALTGWSDPRTWSLQSLKRRGIQPGAVRNFIIRMGTSLADVTVPTEILYSENRKLIDKMANRYFAILDPIKISVSGVSKLKDFASAPLHPDYPKRGKREIPLSGSSIYIEKEDYEKYNGKEVGLINLFSVKLGINAKFASEKIDIESPKIQWLSEPHVKIRMVMPDGKTKEMMAEPAIKNVKIDDIIQLVRIGFCRVGETKKDIVLYFAHK